LKYSIPLLLILCSAFTYAAPNSRDYNTTVHVITTRMVREGNSVAHYQLLTVTIDGKKYELESESIPNFLLMPGDYKARIVDDKHGAGNYDSWRVYEFLFPNEKTRQFLVVGQSE